MPGALASPAGKPELWLAGHPAASQFCSLSTALCLSLGYAGLCLVGKKAMESREPMALKSLKLVYNLTQVVVCATTFLHLLPLITSSPYGVGTVPTAEFEKWVFVYYCCKILDFADTAFMVLGKKHKQVSLLHVWHHGSIVPLFGYYLSTGRGGGMIALLPLFNSLIHVLMYGHYLVTSFVKFGPRHPYNTHWKPLLTGSQMGHHVLCIIYMLSNYAAGNPECTWGVCSAGIAWGLSILGLFAKFYVDSYMNGKHK